MPYSDQVDAEPVRRHLRALVNGGMTVVQIQNLSGVNRTAIRVILGEFPKRKPSVQVRAETASRILRTRLDPSSAIEGLVPAVGTVRRLQALRAMGWTKRALADRLGYPCRQLQIGRTNDIHGWVTAANAERIRELYAELSDIVPAPSRASTRSRRVAAAAGWLTPIWWDDDTLDDPNARPVMAERTENRKTKLPPVDELRWLLDTGESIAAIASRFGVSEDGVSKALGRTPAA